MPANPFDPSVLGDLSDQLASWEDQFVSEASFKQYQRACACVVDTRPPGSRTAQELAAKVLSLTAQLLAFSRAQKLELKPTDVTSLIAGMSEILQTSVGPLVRVTVRDGGTGRRPVGPDAA